MNLEVIRPLWLFIIKLSREIILFFSILEMAALPRRILKETQKLTQDPVPGIEAIPDEKNARYFHIKVFGPADSPYENGKRVWGYRKE